MEIRHEETTIRDRYSGLPVRQLTSGVGHSVNLYFTDEYWLDDERLVYRSDAGGAANLWLYDLSANTSVRLTDLDPSVLPSGTLSHDRRSVVWVGANELYTTDVQTRTTRSVYRGSEEWPLHRQVSVDADGKCCYVIATAAEPRESFGFSYAKSPNYMTLFRKGSRNRVLRIDLSSGTAKTIHETDMYIQHVNASPTIEGVVTFCHEGPWPMVPQRVWGLKPATGAVWPIRPQNRDVALGHEHWLANGTRIAYHGRTLPDQQLHVWGCCDLDNSTISDYHVLPHSTHAHSRDGSLVVFDGTPANVQPFYRRANCNPFLYVARPGDKSRLEPRLVCEHRSTFHASHPHPQIAPDGRTIIFCSDVTGYSQLYLVQPGDLEALPVEFPNTEWETAI